MQVAAAPMFQRHTYSKRLRESDMPLLACVVALVMATLPTTSHADVFLLTTGGRIEGEWLNRDEQPPREYLVRTASGIKTSLQVTQVREVIRQSPLDLEYQRRAAAAADTPAGQWELAEWCREQSLFDQRKTHLRRIVELDPQHAPSWRALGYQFLDGKWITRDQFRRDEGYELYKGKWRTPQEIEILEALARTELAQKEWLQKLRRWRNDLNSPERAKLAYESLAEVRDPLVVKPLGELLARERVRRVKSLYADILAAINTPEAVGVLVQRVLYDPDEEVFHYCLNRLVAADPPHLADPFITALKDRNNVTVNRAAAALGRIDDRTAISPLIAALVTTHARVLPGRASPDATSATFSGDGSSSLAGNQGPQIVISRVRNQPVLDALIRLTGANFEYDQERWRYWHAQERVAQEASQSAVDARRQ
jgi:hypothetical protein